MASTARGLGIHPQNFLMQIIRALELGGQDLHSTVAATVPGPFSQQRTRGATFFRCQLNRAPLFSESANCEDGAASVKSTSIPTTERRKDVSCVSTCFVPTTTTGGVPLQQDQMKTTLLGALTLNDHDPAFDQSFGGVLRPATPLRRGVTCARGSKGWNGTGTNSLDCLL